MACQAQDSLLLFLRLRFRRAWEAIDDARAEELVSGLAEHCSSQGPAPATAGAGEEQPGEVQQQRLPTAEARTRLRRVGEALANELERRRPDWALHGSRGEVVHAVASLETRRVVAVQAFETLRGVHEALRSRGEAVPKSDELEAYAQAASIVAGKAWSQEVKRWVLRELGSSEERQGAVLVPERTGEASLRLLDIGSSFGAFCGVPGVRCVALDLAPAHAGVLKANFLEVPITEDLGSEAQVDDRRSLQVLRAGGFDAAVLSLVLSFLPTPKLRRCMLDRARRCLKVPSGALFVIEKTSLAPRGSSEDRSRIQAFQEALEAAGFATRRYATVGLLDGGERNHVHAWHLVAEAAPRPHPGPTFRDDSTHDLR